MELSIVIPLLNEQDSLQELFERIQKVLNREGFTFEVIFVDDGSTDDSWSVISSLYYQHKGIVKGIRFTRNFGKSQALNAGFSIAKGEVVITMDADLQDFPEEIPKLYKMIKDEGWDLVSGWKKKRFDNYFTKNLPSKLFNYAAQKVSGIKLHDFNCGLKAYRLEVIKNIDVYGEMHRYIPVLAKNAGFNKIAEKVVQHQARRYGTSKFGSSRFIRGFLDLITLWFVSKFGSSPMHFFGLVGTLMFLGGSSAAVWLGAQKLVKVYFKIPAKLLTDNAWFYISLTCMILGTQLFIAGFLGEMIVRSRRSQQDYILAEKLE